MTIGLLILAALVLYESRPLLARLRTQGRLRREGKAAPLTVGRRRRRNDLRAGIRRAPDDDPDRVDRLIADRPQAVR